MCKKNEDDVPPPSLFEYKLSENGLPSRPCVRFSYATCDNGVKEELHTSTFYVNRSVVLASERLYNVELA